MFGKSIFQSVLDRLEAEDENDPDTETAERFAVRGLNAGFALDTAETAAGAAVVRQAYADMGGPNPTVTVRPPERPAVSEPASPAIEVPDFTRLTQGEIAADLALSATDTIASLAEKRRHFAADNHPDRHPPDVRKAATIRMTIANMLIDESLRRLKRGLTPMACDPHGPDPGSRPRPEGTHRPRASPERSA